MDAPPFSLWLMKTETRFVKCGGVGFTIVCNPDDTVAILDSDGKVITGPTGITATDVRTRSDAELCRLLDTLRR